MQFFARAAGLPLVEHHGHAPGGEPVAVSPISRKWSRGMFACEQVC